MTKEMKSEWVREITSHPCTSSESYNSRSRFVGLIKFLQQWRNRLEYVGASIREEVEVGLVNHVRGGDKYKSESKKPATGKRPRCWLHNLEGDAGDHPIWRCKSFLSKPTKERTELATANNVCHRCLNLNCAGAQDISKCIRGFRCSVSGCEGIHNHLLHVDKGSSFHAGTANCESVDNPLLPTQIL